MDERGEQIFSELLIAAGLTAQSELAEQFEQHVHLLETRALSAMCLVDYKQARSPGDIIQAAADANMSAAQFRARALLAQDQLEDLNDMQLLHVAQQVVYESAIAGESDFTADDILDMLRHYLDAGWPTWA